MSGDLERLFLREKPALALLAVGEIDQAYAALVAKRIDSTFPHTSAILSQLEEQGLISSRSEGRVRYLALTSRGIKVARALTNLRDALKPSGKDWSRLEKIDALLAEASGRSGESFALRAGPLRRDLSRLKSSEDEDLRKAAEDLDLDLVKSITKIS
jgi:DNA-binding transcriptional ArsR family regulator